MIAYIGSCHTYQYTYIYICLDWLFEWMESELCGCIQLSSVKRIVIDKICVCQDRIFPITYHSQLNTYSVCMWLCVFVCAPQQQITRIISIAIATTITKKRFNTREKNSTYRWRLRFYGMWHRWNRNQLFHSIQFAALFPFCFYFSSTFRRFNCFDRFVRYLQPIPLSLSQFYPKLNAHF